MKRCGFPGSWEHARYVLVFSAANMWIVGFRIRYCTACHNQTERGALSYCIAVVEPVLGAELAGPRGRVF